MSGLYIHVPFCRKKCYYCDFYSLDSSEALIDKYLHALALEADSYPRESISSIYIGGGTPSILKDEQIKFLFSSLEKSFNIAFVDEITFEANPESITEGMLGLLSALGVNRLSIGLQSSSDSGLSSLGRIHDFGSFVKAYKSARHLFKNINIDLIYGIPGQSLKNWRADIDAVLQFDPEHISLYPLTIEPGTIFNEQGIKTDDALESDMFYAALETLKMNGYFHYEISNFSKPGRESRHNILYWQNMEYIGLGPSAASYFEGKRYRNTLNLPAYIEALNSGIQSHEDIEMISESEKTKYSAILGLRLTKGIDVENGFINENMKKLAALKEQGLIEVSGSNIKLSNKGYMLANKVFMEFV